MSMSIYKLDICLYLLYALVYALLVESTCMFFIRLRTTQSLYDTFLKLTLTKVRWLLWNDPPCEIKCVLSADVVLLCLCDDCHLNTKPRTISRSGTCTSCRSRFTTVTSATAQIEPRASPRKPYVSRCSRSSWVQIFDVKCLTAITGVSSALIPWPLSRTSIRSRP